VILEQEYGLQQVQDKLCTLSAHNSPAPLSQASVVVVVVVVEVVVEVDVEVVVVDVVVVEVVVVDVVVVERLADDLPRMYFVRLKGFFSPLCLAWP